MNVLANFFESIPSAVQVAAQNISSTTSNLSARISKKEPSSAPPEDTDEGLKGETITGAEAWELWEREHKVPYVSCPKTS